MNGRLFYPPAQVTNYSELQVNGEEYKVVNEDGVVVQTGKVLEFDPELSHMDEMTLMCKVILLRKQLEYHRLTPTE